MKCIVIGSSGKIGKYFLNKKDFVFTYNSRKLDSGIKFNLIKDDFSKILKKNISRAVILTSYSDPDFCKKYQKKSRLLNVKKTKKLIDILIKKKIYFIFYSTEFVFDGKKGNYKENDRAIPINIYGKQKLEIEKYIKRKTKNFCIFRIAKTYGDNFNENTLITDFLKKTRKNNMPILAATDQIFSPIYVKDLVKITEIFLKKKINGIYNVGGNQAINRYDLYKKFNAYLKDNNYYKPVRIIKKKLNDFKFIDKRPHNVSFNIAKLKKIIKFKLSNIEEIFIKIKNEKLNSR
jgi:dTDP-4-dehydrorhamnose reductase